MAKIICCMACTAFMGNETAGALLEQEGFEVALFDYCCFTFVNRHVKICRDGLMRTMLMKRCTLSAIVWADWSYAILQQRIRIKSAPYRYHGYTAPGSRAAQRVQHGFAKPVLGGSYKGALDGSMPELPRVLSWAYCRQ